MHTYKLANSISDGPITTPLSVLCILVEVLSPAHANSGQSRNDFQFGTSSGRFPSGDAASIIIHSFYIALFSALEQTHSAHWHVILNE